MVVAMVNSPMQTSHSVGCKTQDSAEQDTINDVSFPIWNSNFFHRKETLSKKSQNLVNVVEECPLALPHYE